ncbi:MAG TPA: helix-turn-helix domain-containing protein, partial [Ktedonobacterales bacterium]|nr:helix-turn-helix domain-containing protein [Ktedonobacterales bacterium]
MAKPSALGILLKRYRAAAGLAQEGLAERAGVSTRAISDLERGLHRRPHPDTLNRLATTLALSADQRAMLLAAAQPETLAPDDEPAAPPLAPGVAPPAMSPLPIPPTSLIGRQRERQRAVTDLREASTRLLTITGPGGAGKTRLALAIAHDLAAMFPDGTCYVELAALREAARVAAAVAAAVGLRERVDSSFAEQVRTLLRDKRLLLVLDNCEHLLDAAPFVADLLAYCPALAILATSRAPLRLRAERTLPLTSLPLDDAVALFRDRALALWPDGVYDEPEMVAICQRLDCLPLAIELAAAHARVLSLPQLRDSLARRLPLLRDGAADLPDRQRTMEDAIGWSYDLLSEDQRRSFRALGVFVSGCTLDAARAVCWQADTGESLEGITILAALVDASLLQTETLADGTLRLRPLELVREYAVARLRAAGEDDACQRRHAAYFAALADDAVIYGPGPRATDLGLARELPNARAALEWAEAHHEAELGLRLAGFARIWHLRGELSEALSWQERMLALDAAARQQGHAAAPLPLRVRQLYAGARILLALGAFERAHAAAEEALNLARQAGDEDGAANACATLGMIAQARGDLDAAEAAFAMSAAHAEAAARSQLRHRALTHLGEIARARGDLARADALLREALAAVRDTGNIWETAMIVTLLGHTARQRGHYAQARMHYRESLTLFSAFGSPPFLAWCLEGLAATRAAEDDPAS